MQWRQPVLDFGHVASVPVDMQPCECLGPIPVWAQTSGRAGVEARPSFKCRKAFRPVISGRAALSVGRQNANGFERLWQLPGVRGDPF
jgi:hypothetical protein